MRRLGRLAGILVLLSGVVASDVSAIGADVLIEKKEDHSALWSGVTLRQVSDELDESGRNPGHVPVTYSVVHASQYADVRLKPIVSGGWVGAIREPVSEMCGRVQGIACVNASFATSGRSSVPFGGLVRKGQLLQTPTEIQDQLRIHGRRLSSGHWDADVRLIGGAPDVAEELAQLVVDDVNTAPADESIQVHTARFGPTTYAPPGTYEVVFRGSSVQWVGVDRQPLTFVGVRVDGNARIPADGLVVSGIGPHAAHRLWRWTETHLGHAMALHVESPSIESGVSGHPRLLVAGERTVMDQSDGKVVNRHPRTAIGWNDTGEVWLVVVDGRSTTSAGMDLAELQELFLELGADDALNLDGGGSATLSTWCPEVGWCVRNRPSDGRERVVPVALALVPSERW